MTIESRLGKTTLATLAGMLWALSTTAAHAQTNNTSYGTNALISITTGDHDTAMGWGSLKLTSSGSSNTGFGRGTLLNNASGNDNTSVGYNALFYNTASENTAVGAEALLHNTTGPGNSAFGAFALVANTTGPNNAAFGMEALISNTTGNSNTAVGTYTLRANASGSANTALGASALEQSTGSSNTGLGAAAATLNSSGNYNTAVGASALFYNFTGSYNTAVGSDAGPPLAAPGLSNTSAFGNGASVTASNTIRIGNSSITSIGGAVGWSNLSDARFKTHVAKDVPGLAFIEKLVPVSFNYDLDQLAAFEGATMTSADEVIAAAKEAKESKRYTGFLAQQVEAAAQECGYDFSGVVAPANEHSAYQLTYSEFVVPLVRAVQEQQEEIHELRAAVAELRGGGAQVATPVHAGMLGDRWSLALALVAGLFFSRFRSTRAGR